MNETLQNKIAAAIAHRGCCGVEHDTANGKLHGFCVVCGVPWPCETAQTFMFKRPEKRQSFLTTRHSAVILVCVLIFSLAMAGLLTWLELHFRV